MWSPIWFYIFAIFCQRATIVSKVRPHYINSRVLTGPILPKGYGYPSTALKSTKDLKNKFSTNLMFRTTSSVCFTSLFYGLLLYVQYRHSSARKISRRNTQHVRVANTRPLNFHMRKYATMDSFMQRWQFATEEGWN